MSDQISTTSKYRETNWGFDEVLSNAETYKVKKLTIAPGHRISLQSHEHRSEHWLLLEGEGLITIGDALPYILKVGDTEYVPAKTVHRIANEGTDPLVILEAQFLTGDVLSEEDIVRYADDYGRPVEDMTSSSNG